MSINSHAWDCPHGKEFVRAIILSFMAISTMGVSEVHAQKQLSAVVVTASRFEENSNEVPATVKVITREQIVQSSAQNVVEVLSQLGGLLTSGFNLGQLGLGASVDLGGYGATANSNTLVLIDGQKLNPIDSSTVAWESLSMNQIDRIEILQGGASVQYGNGAVGGVINIITNSSREEATKLKSRLGSFSTLFNSAFVSRNDGDILIQSALNTANTQGWRQNAAANSYAFNMKGVKFLTPSDRVSAEVFLSHANAQSPGGVVGRVGQSNAQLAKFNNVGATNTGDNAGIKLAASYSFNALWRFEGESVYRTRSSQGYAPYYESADSVANGYPGGPTQTNIQSSEYSLTPRLKADWDQWGSSVVGYDFSHAQELSGNVYGALAQQAILANQYATDPGNPYYNNLLADKQSAALVSHSVYLIHRLPLNAKLELSGGFRRQLQSTSAYDSNISSAGALIQNSSFSANAFDVALNYRYLPKQRVYVKWNQSFRFANIDEFWGFDPNSYARIFSGALKPQIAQTLEGGGQWQFTQTFLTASLFQSTTHKEIKYNPTTFYNTNDANAIARTGVMLDATYKINEQWSVAGGGKYQQSDYVSGPQAHQSVALVPQWLLNARSQYTIDRRWWVGGDIHYVGSQYPDSNPTVTSTLNQTAGYFVANGLINFHSGPWETRLTIKNMTNTRYASTSGYGFVSQPGGTGLNSYYYYPGEKRAFYLSLQYTL